MLTTININSFHGRFSVLNILRSPFKLKIFNCSHRHHSELAVHQDSMIEVVIPENYFIMLHCGLVHYGTSSWFINRGEYSSNTLAFFTIVEKGFNLRNEITVQMENELWSMETCHVCKNN